VSSRIEIVLKSAIVTLI